MGTDDKLPDRIRAWVAREFNAKYVDSVTQDLIDVAAGNREGNSFERQALERIMSKQNKTVEPPADVLDNPDWEGVDTYHNETEAKESAEDWERNGEEYVGYEVETTIIPDEEDNRKWWSVYFRPRNSTKSLETETGILAATSGPSSGTTEAATSAEVISTGEATDQPEMETTETTTVTETKPVQHSKRIVQRDDKYVVTYAGHVVSPPDHFDTLAEAEAFEADDMQPLELKKLNKADGESQAYRMGFEDGRAGNPQDNQWEFELANQDESDDYDRGYEDGRKTVRKRLTPAAARKLLKAVDKLAAPKLGWEDTVNENLTATDHGTLDDYPPEVVDYVRDEKPRVAAFALVQWGKGSWKIEGGERVPQRKRKSTMPAAYSLHDAHDHLIATFPTAKHLVATYPRIPDYWSIQKHVGTTVTKSEHADVVDEAEGTVHNDHAEVLCVVVTNPVDDAQQEVARYPNTKEGKAAAKEMAERINADRDPTRKATVEEGADGIDWDGSAEFPVDGGEELPEGSDKENTYFDGKMKRRKAGNSENQTQDMFESQYLLTKNAAPDPLEPSARVRLVKSMHDGLWHLENEYGVQGSGHDAREKAADEARFRRCKVVGERVEKRAGDDEQPTDAGTSCVCKDADCRHCNGVCAETHPKGPGGYCVQCGDAFMANIEKDYACDEVVKDLAHETETARLLVRRVDQARPSERAAMIEGLRESPILQDNANLAAQFDKLLAAKGTNVTQLEAANARDTRVGGRKVRRLRKSAGSDTPEYAEGREAHENGKERDEWPSDYDGTQRRYWLNGWDSVDAEREVRGENKSEAVVPGDSIAAQPEHGTEVNPEPEVGSVDKSDGEGKYRDIVFMQGEDAEEPLRILEEDGEEAALEYLTQWDNGDGEMRDENPAGSGDDVYEDEHYVMSYNTRMGYIGLVGKVPAEKSVNKVGAKLVGPDYGRGQASPTGMPTSVTTGSRQPQNRITHMTKARTRRGNGRVKAVTKTAMDEVARAWDEMAEDMVDDLELGDKAVVDVRTGKLEPFSKQPEEVRQIWWEAYEDAHGENWPQTDVREHSIKRAPRRKYSQQAAEAANERATDQGSQRGREQATKPRGRGPLRRMDTGIEGQARTPKSKAEGDSPVPLSMDRRAFDAEWQRLAELGYCDALGGSEYRRKLMQWVKGGRIADITDLISDGQAGSKPDEGSKSLRNGHAKRTKGWRVKSKSTGSYFGRYKTKAEADAEAFDANAAVEEGADDWEAAPLPEAPMPEIDATGIARLRELTNAAIDSIVEVNDYAIEIGKTNQLTHYQDAQAALLESLAEALTKGAKRRVRKGGVRQKTKEPVASITCWWDDRGSYPGWYCETVLEDGSAGSDSQKVWFPVDVDSYDHSQFEELQAALQEAFPSAEIEVS